MLNNRLTSITGDTATSKDFCEMSLYRNNKLYQDVSFTIILVANRVMSMYHAYLQNYKEKELYYFPYFTIKKIQNQTKRMFNLPKATHLWSDSINIPTSFCLFSFVCYINSHVLAREYFVPWKFKLLLRLNPTFVNSILHDNKYFTVIIQDN